MSRFVPGCVVFAVCSLAVAAFVAPGASAAPAPELAAGPTLDRADWPNDPEFARCELEDPVTGCRDNEQWNLYGPMDGLCRAPGQVEFTVPRPDGGLPCWARNATDPEGSSGVNVTGAWAQGNWGRDEVLVAYMEGGVNYSSNSIKDGLNAIYLNEGELPYPRGWNGQDLGRYDFDGNGRFDIRDYAKDPRVNPACADGVQPFVTEQEGTTRGCAPSGTHTYIHSVNIAGPRTPYLSPEDLIAVFGKCEISGAQVLACEPDGRFDNDDNGYPNDISGWNAYHKTNDPQTENLDYGHASSLIKLIGAQTNNDFGGVGVCARCRVVPIKSGAESIGHAVHWAPALTYAADIGADVVSSVVVSYAYSGAGKAAVDYALGKGMLLSFDSNDFDAMDHTDGHLYEGVFPGNGLAQDVEQNPQSFRARSNVTSYGTHSVFSTGETTTSGATPFQAALLGMVQSAALNAVDEGSYPRRLTPNEVRQVLMNTASEILPQRDHPDVQHQWPGNPDSKTDSTHTAWSTQYGYGRVNIGKATKLIMDGRVPPTAELTSPEWYQYFDPTRKQKVQIKGSVAPSAWDSEGLDWVLEWALGANPADSAFRRVSSGKGGKSGVLGVLDMSKIPSSFAARKPGAHLPPDGPEQYSVTIRLRARDGNGLKGEDRRSIGARTDRDLVKGFPRNIGTEISAAPSFVALTGKRRQDLVFGTNDGVVQALDPTGKPVAGFPVRTRQMRQISPLNPQGFESDAYRTVKALREARDPISGIAVGDLYGNGSPSIVASTASGWIYAWNRQGKPRNGFPVETGADYRTLPVPTPPTTTRSSRLPIQGAWSPPVLADLKGNGKLSILMSSYDGHVYAVQPNGAAVPGWPVEVELPASIRNTIADRDYVRDPKLIMAPSVGDVLGIGRDQVFLPSYECNRRTSKIFAYGIHPDGMNAPNGPFLEGWPVAMSALAGCYQESIDFVQEGANAATIADYDGNGTLEVTITPAGGFPTVLRADGVQTMTMDGGCNTEVCGGIPPYYVPDPLVIGLTGQGAAGDLDGDGKVDYSQPVAGAISLTGALDVAGQAALPHTYDGAWNVETGQALPNFPNDQDGFPFFSAPLLAGVSDDGKRSVITSNDSYWIHAYRTDGKEAPGFPKWTGQWTSFGGVLGDPNMNGKQRLAFGTREGTLFLWDVKGRSADNDQWWHLKHDEHNSGRYGNDTRPPAGLPVSVEKKPGRAILSWRAPGNNGVSNGKALRYEGFVSDRPIGIADLDSARQLALPAPGRPNSIQKTSVRTRSGRVLYIAIRSVDRAGNHSLLSRVKLKGAR